MKLKSLVFCLILAVGMSFDFAPQAYSATSAQTDNDAASMVAGAMVDAMNTPEFKKEILSDENIKDFSIAHKGGAITMTITFALNVKFASMTPAEKRDFESNFIGGIKEGMSGDGGDVISQCKALGVSMRVKMKDPYGGEMVGVVF
ncbi:MAG: hypothetical protein Q4F07_06700 [Bacteroidales bacterium]|nr:hypothetical protein [Bacteroidales bacterium]